LADGTRAPQPLGDGGDRRDVVAAFQVQEEEVIERIPGQPLAALTGIYGHRLLPAPPLLIGEGALVGYEDAEGRGAVGPQVYEDVLVLEGTWILIGIVTGIRHLAGGETHEQYTSKEPSPGGRRVTPHVADQPQATERQNDRKIRSIIGVLLQGSSAWWRILRGANGGDNAGDPSAGCAYQPPPKSRFHLSHSLDSRTQQSPFFEQAMTSPSENSQKRRLRLLGGGQNTLACVVGMCLALGTSKIESQTRPRSSAEWDQAAAADYLDARQAWWRTWPVASRDHDTSCVSCHTTLPYALARPALRSALGETGPTVPEVDLLADVGKRVALWNEVDPYYPDQTVGLPKTSESRGTEAILNALILASRDAQQGHLTSETRKAFENLWKLQFTRGEEAGAWAWLYFGLAPWESEGAAYFGAALAAVAVGVAPNQYATSTQIQDRVALLRAYLQQDSENRPPLDRVMLLWASTELSDLLTRDQQQSIIGDVIRLQNSDGGWSLTSLGLWDRPDGLSPDPGSGGYATGLVTFVLQKAGISPAQENVSRALAWLVQNQDLTSGRWPSSSLNRERDPTSDRGLLMADAATGFAVLALVLADPSNE